MSITYNPVGTNVRLRFLQVNGVGGGLTAQVPDVRIRRRSDGQYWNGVAFQVLAISLPMTEESAVDLPGSYFFDFNQALAGGSPEEYLVRYTNPAAPPNTALDEEQHVFVTFATSLAPERRMGHALADDGVSLKVALWMEEGGARITLLSQIAAQIKDVAGNLIVNLGIQTVQSADGVFSFTTPITSINRNQDYILAAQATQGIVTTSYNMGFVRV